MKQKVSILSCLTVAILSLLFGLLFRYVWSDMFWTKLFFAVFGASGLLTVILQLGRRAKK